jgi:hypothetical protein
VQSIHGPGEGVDEKDREKDPFLQADEPPYKADELFIRNHFNPLVVKKW